MSDPTEPLRNFLDAARFIQADIDALSVGKPAAGQPPVLEEIVVIIRRWRFNIDRRARGYLDGPADFIGRMLLDEVAEVDAWLGSLEVHP